MAKQSGPHKKASQTRKARTRAVDPDAPTNAERIWQVVASIPPGKVATYGQVAELAGLPRAARLVGNTLGKLPSGSKLPWFRVLNAKGELSFPRDSSRWRTQRDKLASEGVVLLKGRLKLRRYRWEP